MKLAGDLAEFSLADLVQVAGVARRTCCVKVLAAEGNGALYLDGGEVVSAAFEDLTGFEAFVALVAARAGHFEIEDGAAPPRPNMSGKVQALLLDANAQIVAGRAPRPRRRAPQPAVAADPAPGAPATTPATAASHRHDDSAHRGWWIGGVAALVLVGAGGWLTFARSDAAARGGAGAHGGAAIRTGAGGSEATASADAAPDRPQPVEVTRLTGARDAKPVLIAGPPPLAPDPASGLKPTIVCRLLIGADGRVADAKIYRSRLDLAAFEDAALDAVRRYRFSPGRLAGDPVAVWINWPVAFR